MRHDRRTPRGSKTMAMLTSPLPRLLLDCGVEDLPTGVVPIWRTEVRCAVSIASGSMRSRSRRCCTTRVLTVRKPCAVASVIACAVVCSMPRVRLRLPALRAGFFVRSARSARCTAASQSRSRDSCVSVYGTRPPPVQMKMLLNCEPRDGGAVHREP